MMKTLNRGKEAEMVFRVGQVFWYQFTMAYTGEKLGKALVAVIEVSRFGALARCIFDDGETDCRNIYPDGVLDQVATPRDIKRMMRLAAEYHANELSREFAAVLPQQTQSVA